MKRFLKNISLFLFIAFIGIALMPLINTALLKYNLNDSTTMIIMGDSHPESAIVDKIFPHAINVSQSAETYFFTYNKLKKIYKYNNQIDTLILSFSPHNISFFQEKKLFGLNNDKRYVDIYSRYYNILDLKNLHYLLSNTKGNIIKTFSRYLKLNLKGIIKLKPTYIGSFRKSFNSNLSDSIINNKVKIHFFSSDKKEYKTSNVQKKYLNKIKKFCVKHNITLVIVNIPVYQKYKKQTPENLVLY